MKNKPNKSANEQWWLVGVEITQQEAVLDPTAPVNRFINVRQNDVTSLSPVEYLASLLPHCEQVCLFMAQRITKAEAERAAMALQRAAQIAKARNADEVAGLTLTDAASSNGPAPVGSKESNSANQPAGGLSLVQPVKP